MNKFILFLCLFLISAHALSESLSESFPAGKGAKYKIKMASAGEDIALSLYVAGTKVDSVNIEYFMETTGLFSVQLWQQFEIGVGSGGSEIRRGYVQSKELPKPEKMPDEYLRGAQGGVQVNDFLFQDKKKLEKMKIGEETVEIAAGTTKATHYRTSSNGQTVDFWISDDAKPMGLVLLKSSSPKVQSQNYSIELLSLVQNVKAKIVPENSVPLTEKGKSFLAKPESIR